MSEPKCNDKGVIVREWETGDSECNAYSQEYNRHNAVFLRQSGKRPQNIVRLKALLLENRDVHGLQYLLQKGHLFAQFLRHTLSGSLVAVKGSVAEGGRMQIKSNGNRLCLRHFFKPDRKSTRLNSSHPSRSRMPSSA